MQLFYRLGQLDEFHEKLSDLKIVTKTSLIDKKTYLFNNLTSECTSFHLRTSFYIVWTDRQTINKSTKISQLFSNSKKQFKSVKFPIKILLNPFPLASNTFFPFIFWPFIRFQSISPVKFFKINL